MRNRASLLLAVGLTGLGIGVGLAPVSPVFGRFDDPPPAAKPDVPAAAAALDSEALKFFEAEVRPLLAESCWSCHDASKQKGGLRLDSREAILQGGESGPAVIPNKPDESLLLDAIHRRGPEMPPKGKLADDQIATLTKWVEIGAPWLEAHGASTNGAVKSAKRTITDQDRKFWSYQPLKRPDVPRFADDSWSKTPIDAFLLARLRSEGLAPSQEADRRALIRRAAFDLWGLPPTPEEVEEFVNDPAPLAYEALIDRLLASPRYGERWGRHWLDLVRFAESDGHRQDAYRPEAWRYRDYVIRSLNDDKPYNRFVTEQLAGDELDPADPEMRIATAFLRHGPYEYNQRDARGQWRDILNDITDVTGDLFLGMSVGCARCHDHKFDPILQDDYYRLQAFFTPLLPRDDLPLARPREWMEHQEKLAAWERKTEAIRAKMAAIEKPRRDREAKSAIDKFTEDLQAIARKPESERTPYERQLGHLIDLQIWEEWNKIPDKLKTNKEWAELRKQLEAFDQEKPKPFGQAFTVTDVGPIAPPTRVPGDRANRDIEPGFPTVLQPGPARIVPPPGTNSTGRRLALAQWLTRPDNGLAARVIVNRVWQYHFGKGMVATSSDFGKLGETPSHPELLDWLATEFVRQGGSLKKLHRLIMTSASYRQSASGASESGQIKDPENRLLWRWPVRRLDIEPLRDAALAVSGELDPAMGGPSAEFSAPRRTIYAKVIRNTRDPLYDLFDGPESFSSVANRNAATTALQSLMLLNGDWALGRAKAFAKRLRQQSDDPRTQIETAYRRAFGRPPDSDETRRASAFLNEQQAKAGGSAEAALADFCHVLFNSNEFLYIE